MRSSFFGFHVASSGLFTARANLNVTSHNIANSEIPGFSRQVAQARAGNPMNLRDGRGMYGTGSQVTGIIQIRDRFLDMRFWGQRAVHGRFEVQNTHLNFVETVFNQLPDAGVLRTFGDFFGRLSSLTTNANDATFRTSVITGADTLAEQIRHKAQTLQTQQADINREVADVVSIINSLGSQIASLNEQINIFERDGSNANDLRDQRALLIDELSQYVNVQVEERNFANPPENPFDRRLTVMIDGNDFINHDMFNRLKVVARNDHTNPLSGPSRNEMDVPGLYDIFFAATNVEFNIYSQTLGGQLRGLIEVRDGNNGFSTAHEYVLGGPFIPNNPNTWPPTFIPSVRGPFPPSFDINNHMTWPSATFSPLDRSTWPAAWQANADMQIDAPPGFDLTNPSTWPRGVLNDPAATAIPGTGRPVTRDLSTNRFKGIPFYMNQLNHLVRTFARSINEGLNVDLQPINGASGHIWGFDGYGNSNNTMFFTFDHPVTGQPAVVLNGETGAEQAHSLRRWIIERPDGTRFIQERFESEVPIDGIDPVTGLPVDMSGTPGGLPEGYTVARDGSGNALFSLCDRHLNAFNFQVNPALVQNQNLLAASSNPDIGQANNDIVHGFLQVGNDRTLFREGRLLDFIIATSNHLAVDNQQASNFRLSYEEISMQTHNHRLSIKGVDVNEEMMNLVRFQTLFTASSRLVNVLDSIYDTLINRLGNF